tara:strand:- start:178 stop:1197 length:1020 start_codon:yes stop_codon:yes gene_type:complete
MSKKNHPILITGAAGFIGSALALKLLDIGHNVVGIDNHNDYYSPNLKEARIYEQLKNKNYKHLRIDLISKDSLNDVFKRESPQIVINLAAQAGVRYSIENPFSFIESNLIGFSNILENCRRFEVEHLVYASSSSVYGANESTPFSVSDNVDHPLSLYAATKKSNELMAHAYSNLYSLPTTGLRFFTVYGPWDRPDMAIQKFSKAIVNNKPLKIYNYGKHSRDFTFIDDIVKGILKVIESPAESNLNWSGKSPDPSTSKAPWKIYNIGNNKTVDLMYLIKLLEDSLGQESIKEFLPMQPGDVEVTWADIDSISQNLGYSPSVSIEEGIEIFSRWFKNYYL